MGGLSKHARANTKKPTMAFRNAIALVSGGSSGLGWATAHRVAAAGGKAVIMDLPKSDPTAKIADLGLQDRMHFSPGDVTSVSDVENAIKMAVEKHGRVDLGVNCAGIGAAFTTNFKKMTAEQKMKLFTKIITVNTAGSFNFINQLAMQMEQQEPRAANDQDASIDHDSRGVICLTASVAAFDGQRGQAAYSASKGGVVGMTLPIARDLAKSKIRINTLAPGIFDTPMFDQLPPEHKAALGKTVPHPRRLGDPVEFAAMVESIFHQPMLNAETIRLDGAIRMSMG